MSYQITPPPSNLEVTACKFIEELQKVKMESKILHASDIKLARNLVASVKIVVKSLQKEAMEFEKRFEENGKEQN